jgi:hypothetical protein
MSSRERLFSEAEEEADWERGDGRVNRGGAAEEDDEDEAAAVETPLTALVDAGAVGSDNDGRVLVAVDVEAELEAEPVRRWGLKGLGVEEAEDEEFDGPLVLGGAGELRADPP